MSVMAMLQQLAQQCRHLARRSYSQSLLLKTTLESSSTRRGGLFNESVPHSKEFRALSF